MRKIGQVHYQTARLGVEQSVVGKLEVSACVQQSADRNAYEQRAVDLFGDERQHYGNYRRRQRQYRGICAGHVAFVRLEVALTAQDQHHSHHEYQRQNERQLRVFLKLFGSILHNATRLSKQKRGKE